MKKFFTFSIVVFSLMIVFLPWTTALAAQALPGGLIPCGNGNDPCTLCHFIIGFHNLVTVMLKLLVTVALAGIFIAGVMYIVSAGDETAMTSAKNFLKASVIGFSVVLGAWLIVNITMWVFSANLGVIGKNWYTFSCSTESSTYVPAPSTAPTNTPAIETDVNSSVNEDGTLRGDI